MSAFLPFVVGATIQKTSHLDFNYTCIPAKGEEMFTPDDFGRMSGYLAGGATVDDYIQEQSILPEEEADVRWHWDRLAKNLKEAHESGTQLMPPN